MMNVKLFDNVLNTHEDVTRASSPKITSERKNRDFTNSYHVKSPRRNVRNLSFSQDVKLPPSMSRYVVQNADFAKGAYGKISIALDQITKELVVIKTIKKSVSLKMVRNEVRAGQLLGSHPQIASFLGYYEQTDHHSLVFSYIQAQDLFGYLEHRSFSPRTEEESKIIIVDVLSALQHTHSKKIAHRDVKLENILLNKNGRAFLIDYGLCGAMLEGTRSREWCGSDNYLAPEIVRRIPYDGYKVDVFSSGVILFALLFGVFPFENLRVNRSEAAASLPRLKLRFPIDVAVSDQAKDLISWMVEDDFEKRFTVAECLQDRKSVV